MYHTYICTYMCTYRQCLAMSGKAPCLVVELRLCIPVPRLPLIPGSGPAAHLGVDSAASRTYVQYFIYMLPRSGGLEVSKHDVSPLAVNCRIQICESPYRIV